MVLEKLKNVKCFNRPKETDLVLNYSYALCHGEVAEKPDVEIQENQELLLRFEAMLEREKKDSKLIIDLFKNKAALSDFDVNMSFIANDISELSMKLTSNSTSNMVIVQETTAGMDEVGEAIATSTVILEDFSEKSDLLAQMTEQNSKELGEMADVGEVVIANTDQMGQKIDALRDVLRCVEEANIDWKVNFRWIHSYGSILWSGTSIKQGRNRLGRVGSRKIRTISSRKTCYYQAVRIYI